MKRLYSLLLIILLAAIVLISAACAAKPTPPPPPTPTPTPNVGKALVESRCTTCHPLTIISTVKYDQAAWTFTVERMVNGGAQLNKEQAKQVIDYLALTYK